VPLVQFIVFEIDMFALFYADRVAANIAVDYLGHLAGSTFSF
jgi:hypothetical protein